MRTRVERVRGVLAASLRGKSTNAAQLRAAFRKTGLYMANMRRTTDDELHPAAYTHVRFVRSPTATAQRTTPPSEIRGLFAAYSLHRVQPSKANGIPQARAARNQAMQHSPCSSGRQRAAARPSSLLDRIVWAARPDISWMQRL